LRKYQKFRDARILWALVLAMFIGSVTGTPAFADVSPAFEVNATSAKVADAPIQLAQANLPPIGSIDDYVQQGNEQAGGSATAVPPQAYQQYQPQAAPPPGYYPQGNPPQEFNNSYPDPDAERSALIGAAVVGAVAVGMWAWQQHEIHQAERRANQ
jgi:hypothetical protein